MNGLSAHLAGWRRLEDVDARDMAESISLSQIDRCAKWPHCTGCRHLLTSGCNRPTQDEDFGYLMAKNRRTLELLAK